MTRVSPSFWSWGGEGAVHGAVRYMTVAVALTVMVTVTVAGAAIRRCCGRPSPRAGGVCGRDGASQSRHQQTLPGTPGGAVLPLFPRGCRTHMVSGSDHAHVHMR
jgi:hypothetical protein